MTTVPTMPPEAQPFWLIQAVGRQTLADAWRSCFDAGVAAGRTFGEIEYWKGFVTASLGWVGLLVVALVVAQLLTFVRNAQRDH